MAHVASLTPLRFLFDAIDCYGSRVGIVSGETRLTYAQFGEYCHRVAALLLQLGVQPGDRIAYLSFNNYQLLAGYFAPLLIRATFLPLNVRLTVPELTAIVQRSGARVLLFEREFQSIAGQLQTACPCLRSIIAIEDPIECEPLRRPSLATIDENETAELFYTSGTTAEPKPVALSHRTLYLHALAMNARLEQTPVELHAVPLFHANGWGRPHTATMHGARHVLLRRFRAEAVWNIIAEERITGTSFVPTMARLLLADEGLTTADLTSLRHIHLGGAPVSPSLLAQVSRAFSCEVSVGYGLTEAGPVVAVSNTVVGDAIAYLPIAGVSVEVSAEGELLARNNAGCIATGDAAIWTGDGSFQIIDRLKDVIISGGENISSVEVEAAIEEHPAVGEAAVVAAPDPRWGEMPVALIVLRNGCNLTMDELLTHLRSRLAKFKHPRRFQFVAGPLPRTATGKLRKQGLREPFWLGSPDRIRG